MYCGPTGLWDYLVYVVLGPTPGLGGWLGGWLDLGSHYVVQSGLKQSTCLSHLDLHLRQSFRFAPGSTVANKNTQDNLVGAGPKSSNLGAEPNRKDKATVTFHHTVDLQWGESRGVTTAGNRREPSAGYSEGPGVEPLTTQLCFYRV